MLLLKIELKIQVVAPHPSKKLPLVDQLIMGENVVKMQRSSIHL